MLGAFFAVCAAIAFALNSIVLHKGMRGSNPEAAVMINNLTGTAAFGGATLVMWWLGGLPPISWLGVGLFCVAGLLVMVLGRSFDVWSIRLLGPSRANSTRLAEPAIAYVISLFVMHEGLTPIALVGIALVMAALHLLVRDVRKEAAEHPERPRPVLGFAAAVGAMLSMTTGHNVRRLGLAVLPSPLFGMAVAYILANLIFGLSALSSPYVRRRMSQFTRAHVPYFMLSGLLGGFGNYFMFQAVNYAPIPVIVTLRHTAPWWTIALGFLLLRGERVASRWVVYSAVLGVLGVWMIVWA